MLKGTMFPPLKMSKSSPVWSPQVPIEKSLQSRAPNKAWGTLWWWWLALDIIIHQCDAHHSQAKWFMVYFFFSTLINSSAICDCARWCGLILSEINCTPSSPPEHEPIGAICHSSCRVPASNGLVGDPCFCLQRVEPNDLWGLLQTDDISSPVDSPCPPLGYSVPCHPAPGICTRDSTPGTVSRPSAPTEIVDSISKAVPLDQSFSSVTLWIKVFSRNWIRRCLYGIVTWCCCCSCFQWALSFSSGANMPSGAVRRKST